MTEHAVSLQKITKTFDGGRTALRQVSFGAEYGTLLGFAGPNGAGKTTAIRIMVGALAPSDGGVSVFGRTMTPEATDLKRRIGYVSSDDQLFEYLTGREQAELSAIAYGVPRHEAATRIEELFHALELKTDTLPIRHYSHGMKKKVSLACALIHDPELLVLDEPLEGLDVLSARIIKGLLLRMREHGKTILLASHNLTMIDDLCSKIVVIHEGNILFDGTPIDLKSRAGGNSRTALEDAFSRIVGADDYQPEFSWLGHAKV